MKKFLTGLAAAGMLFCTLSASHAITLFAVVNPDPAISGAETPYIWSNNELPDPAGLGTLSVQDTNAAAGIQLDVIFQFLDPSTPVVGADPVPATLTLSAINNGTMLGTTQPIRQFVFEITPKNPGDVFGAGILLRTVVPNPVDFPDGALGQIQGAGGITLLGSEAIQGLIMESSYISIDPDENQTASWSFSRQEPAGALAPDAINMILRDTLFGGNGNFSATVNNVIPEPGSVALLIGLGVGGSLSLIRRRRNR